MDFETSSYVDPEALEMAPIEDTPLPRRAPRPQKTESHPRWFSRVQNAADNIAFPTTAVIAFLVLAQVFLTVLMSILMYTAVSSLHTSVLSLAANLSATSDNRDDPTTQ